MCVCVCVMDKHNSNKTHEPSFLPNSPLPLRESFLRRKSDTEDRLLLLFPSPSAPAFTTSVCADSSGGGRDPRASGVLLRGGCRGKLPPMASQNRCVAPGLPCLHLQHITTGWEPLPLFPTCRRLAPQAAQHTFCTHTLHQLHTNTHTTNNKQTNKQQTNNKQTNKQGRR